VSGSPYRIIIEDESGDGNVEDARDAAIESAERRLDELDVTVPADPIAVNGDGEAVEDGHTILFGRPGYGLDPAQESRELTLETIPVESNMDCAAFMEDDVLGFALFIDGAEIYADEGPLPASRGCVMDYRIHAVVSPAQWSSASGTAVAIISVYSFGFEGPDRRFLAVPLPR
jgi:hypothetical protein